MNDRSRLVMTGIAVTLLGGLASGISARQENADPSEAQADAAALAVETVVRETSLDRNELRIVHVAAMDWPDSSLGCPKPGVAYLQVITPGSIVLLQGPDKVYRVHVGKGRAVVCAAPYQGALQRTPKIQSGMPIETLVEMSRRDLAQKLGVPADDIVVQGIESATWTDSSLGCPDPGRNYSQVDVTGFRITLGHDRQQFLYHSDRKRVFPCPAIERK